MTYLTSVKFLDGGFCQQFARLVGGDNWQWIRFHAIYVHLEHPVHGASLIDTGYSQHFLSATETFPERIYRWATPVTLNEPSDPWYRMLKCGINPALLQRIFISHFHADHIAGLNCLPLIKLVYRPEVYQRLKSATKSEQMRQAFLPKLLPANFEKRAIPLPESRFVAGTGDLAAFRVCDYWGDGSLILVDLPGHADGQFGFVMNMEKERIFYIVDATWHLDTLLKNSSLPWVSQRFQHDWIAYQDTQAKLRELAKKPNWNLVACHCPRTLPRVIHAHD